MPPSRTRAPGAVRGGIARESRSLLFGGARRRRLPAWLVTCAALVAVFGVVAAAVPVRAGTPAPEASVRSAPTPSPDGARGDRPEPMPVIRWRRSRAVGLPWSGRLVRAVQLPAGGPDWFTWDTVRDERPGRGGRRWGTDALVRITLAVARRFRAANPGAPRVGIGDLSRPRGGPFGPEFGGLGHASHQNGLDIDVWYPRRDGLERRPARVSQVDRALAQDLVDRFVAAGAEKVFVGPRLGLRGPRDVVMALEHHDDHLHARIPVPQR